MSEQRRDIGFVLCLCAIAAIPFLPALGGGITNWDDDVNVANNPYVHAGVRDGLLPLLRAPYLHLYVPATYAVWWMGYHLWGGAALGYHLLNLACHLVSVVMLYQILRAILKSRWAALLACAWWAVHPLQAEPVAWITGLKDVLGGMLALVCWRLYIAWREQPVDASAARRRRLLFAASGLAFLLACLAKPGVVLLPLVLAGYDLLIAGRKPRQLWALAPFVAVAALTAAMTLAVHRPEQAGVQTAIGSGGRLLVAADSAAFYLEKLSWPTALSPVYARNVEHGLIMPAAWIRLAALCGAVLIVGLLGKRWWLGAIVFVAGWAPVSGLISFGYQAYSSVADRYAYLPAIGAALALGDLITRFEPESEGGREWSATLARGLAGLWILVFATLTWDQAGVWQNSLSIWGRTLECNPRPPAPVLANYGSALFHGGEDSLRAGRLKEAREAFEDARKILQRCVEEKPEYASGHYNLGRALQSLGRNAEAEEEYREALRRNPRKVNWWIALGCLEAEMNNYAGCAEASQHALDLEPRNAMAALNLGQALKELKQPAEAARALEIAVAAAPEDYEARFQYADALAKSGECARARVEFSKVAAAPDGRASAALRRDAAVQADQLAKAGH